VRNPQRLTTLAVLTSILLVGTGCAPAAPGTGGAKPDLQMKNGCPVFNAANVRKAGGLANARQFENALDAFRYDVGSRCARTDDRSMWR